MSLDRILEGHHSVMGDVVWLLVCLIRHWLKHILFHNQRTPLRLYQLLLLERVNTARYIIRT